MYGKIYKSTMKSLRKSGHEEVEERNCYEIYKLRTEVVQMTRFFRSTDSLNARYLELEQELLECLARSNTQD